MKSPDMWAQHDDKPTPGAASRQQLVTMTTRRRRWTSPHTCGGEIGRILLAAVLEDQKKLTMFCGFTASSPSAALLSAPLITDRLSKVSWMFVTVASFFSLFFLLYFLWHFLRWTCEPKPTVVNISSGVSINLFGEVSNKMDSLICKSYEPWL